MKLRNTDSWEERKGLWLFITVPVSELSAPFLSSGGGTSRPCFSGVGHSPEISMWSLTQKLSKARPFGFLQRLHHRAVIHYIVGHWWLSSLSSPSSLSRGVYVGAKEQDLKFQPLITWLVLLAVGPPSIVDCHKLPHYHNQRHLHHSLFSLQLVGSLSPGPTGFKAINLIVQGHGFHTLSEDTVLVIQGQESFYNHLYLQNHFYVPRDIPCLPVHYKDVHSRELEPYLRSTSFRLHSLDQAL